MYPAGCPFRRFANYSCKPQNLSKARGSRHMHTGHIPTATGRKLAGSRHRARRTHNSGFLESNNQDPTCAFPASEEGNTDCL